MEARCAVVVGVDRYLDPALSDLRGAVADARAMAALLVERFGFGAAAVELLVDGAATAAGIEGALERLVRRVAPGGVAVVFFAGHGGRRYDASGDEADGWDETIVPCDSGREGRADLDIDDDTLDGYLTRLAARAAPVVILDCCHSGTAARARRRSGGASGRRGRGLTARAAAGVYALIAGAAADESARERPPSPGEAPRGVLTTALVRALRAAGPDATWRRVMAEVAAEVGARAPQQHPQLEGAGREWRVFAPTGSDGGWVAATHDAAGVAVALGRLHGVAVGDRLMMLPLRDDRLPVMTTVEAVGAVACRCAGVGWPAGPARARAPAGPPLWTMHIDDGLEVGFGVEGAGGGTVADGEAVALRIDNPSGTRLHLALVEVDDDERAEVLLPAPGSAWAIEARSSHTEWFDVALPLDRVEARHRLVLVAVNVPFDASALASRRGKGLGVPSVSAARCAVRRVELTVGEGG